MTRNGERPGGAAGRRETDDEGGLRPRYRRGFGCVTWVNMGILTFLAAATIFALPLRYVGEGAGFGQVLSLLSFFGLALFLPAMVLGFVLGARTYRVENRLGRRAGALVGAVAGWGCYFGLCWIVIAYGLGSRDQLFRPTPFAGLEGSPLLYAFPVPMLAAAGLVLYALYARVPFERRRRLALVAAGLALAAGALVVAADFDPLGISGGLVSTFAGACGGTVSGLGYARAGGDAMIPPGSTIRPKGPRPPRRKPR